MKILPFVLILLALLRETRHQLPVFPYASFGLSLANEEFIEPPPPPSAAVVVAGTDEATHFEDKTPAPAPPFVLSSPDKPETEKSNLPQVDVKVLSPSLTSDIKPDVPLTDADLAQHNIFHKEEKTLNADVNVQDSSLLADTKVSAQSAQQPDSISELKDNKNETNTTQSPKVESTTEPLTTSAKKKEDEPIPSYMEWAQQKEQELLLNAAQNGQHATGNNGHGSGAHGQNGNGASGNTRNNSLGSVDAKNFASPDCGAKVVQSNSETTNPSGVLSSSHDEYMLNRCGENIWFVVELCEPLTVERISIGNLELFSSSPKEVEFGISDRYPTRDWVKLGPYVLPDARAIHPVHLPPSDSPSTPAASTFGKFVKVSILSHYGSEHYCPVSLIKVNGKSEYEVLERATTHDDDGPKDGGALYEEPIEQETTTTGKVGGLKDAVWNMLNKAVQSIVRRGSSTESSGINDNEHLFLSPCRSVLQCVPPGPMTQDIYKLLSCNSTLLKFLELNSPWCGWDYCHAMWETKSIGLPWQPEGFYASLFGGQSVLYALCHFLKPITDGCDPTCLAINNTLQDASDFSNESLVGNLSVVEIEIDSKGPEIQIQSPLSAQGESEDKATVSPNTETSDAKLSVAEEQPPQQLEIPPTSRTESIPIVGSNPAQTTTPVSTPLQRPQETQIPSPTTATNVQVDDAQNYPSSGQPQQKESVFVRLTNRIKNLEKNQSMTASYLEELSKRFKKQNEENTVIAEANKKSLNETKVKLLQLDGLYRQELSSIRRNMEDLRERLFNVQLQRSLLIVICLSQTIFIIGAIIWMRRKMANSIDSMKLFDVKIKSLQSLSSFPSRQKLSTVERRESYPFDGSSKIQIEPNDHLSRLMRKRSNSDSVPIEKMKRLRRRNRKNATNKTLDAGIKRNVQFGNHHLPFSIPSSVAKASSSEELQKSQTGLDYPNVSKLDRVSPLGDRNSNSLPSTIKENLDPQRRPQNGTGKSLQTCRLPEQNNASTNDASVPPVQKPKQLLTSSLLTKVDSPFTFQSKLANYIDHPEITTSSRFALLASPVRDSHSAPPTMTSQLRDNLIIPPFSRNSSTESSNVSGGNEFVGSSLGPVNGQNHHQKSASISSTDSASGSSLGKGRKKGGLKAVKALMPKFFDR